MKEQKLFVLKSPEFEDGSRLDASYQADRDNRSPALEWSNPPAGTRSFAIAMHDPDAPTGGAGWWHWMMVGIPADAGGLPAGAGGGRRQRIAPGCTPISKRRRQPRLYGLLSA